MLSGSHLNWRKERKWLLALLLISGLVRAWHLVTTEVTARDSIHFIRIAWQLQNQPWNEVLPKATQHPGFPCATMLMGKLILPVFPGDLPLVMQVSAQLVSIFASLILIFPLYGLARGLFSPIGAALGVFLVQFLPVTARLFPDGLSEALFLLFAFSAIWFFQEGIRRESYKRLALAGVFSGCAYLTRPEGGLVFLACLAVGCFLLIGKAIWVVRPGRVPALLGLAILLASFMALAVPYVMTIGRLSSKPTATRILQSNPVEAVGALEILKGQGAVSGPLWAAWYDFQKEGAPGLVWGLWATTGMIVRGLLFVFWVPALASFWKYRQQILRNAGCLAQTIVAVGVFAALVRVAANLGYVSDRHLVLILVPALLMAGGGLADWGAGLWGAGHSFGHSIREKWGRRLYLGFGVSALLVAGRLTLEPLHLNRGGFKTVGHWIRDNGSPGDEVIDPYQWSHYYAGRVFLEDAPLAQMRSNPPVRWVVLEKGKSKHVRLTLPQEEELLAQGAQIAFETTEKPGKSGVGKRLLVYKLPISLSGPGN